jgi:ABC-type glycerol-3-phosphate transport system substrate-binding protein
MRRALQLSVSAAALTLASAAWADCGIEKGSVRILSNDFPALGAVNAAAEDCASPTVTVTRNQTAEHQSLQGPALTTDPATYTVAVVANDSIVSLLNEGLIRPLDELVAEYGQGLQESQLVRIDGKIMAIAFMINAQHLYLRSDLLEEAGVEPPKTYEEVLAAAEAIRAKDLLADPLAASYKPGWNLAADFINMYMGLGGELFEPGSVRATIANEKGVAALETMKALTAYMSPDFVTYDTNALQALWENGETALMNGWGSRATAVLDEDAPLPEVAEATTFAAAPTVGGGTIPASTLWWDGFTIAKNISDEDAAASFRAMVHAIGPETAQAHPNAAAWLIEGYQPTPAAQGVFATLKAGARPYPMDPTMGLLHTAIGNNLIEFLQGAESAEQALADATQAYETSAREAGFLN